MSLQYLTNLNPPPTQSLLKYDVEPGAVFISTGSERLYVNLTITVTNTTSATVDCIEFQFGFLAGAGAGNLTTVGEAASVTATSDQNEWSITTFGFSGSNPNLYLFTATPSGTKHYLPLAPNASLTFHLNDILIDQSVGEGDAPFTIIEQTGTDRRARRTVQGTLELNKETSSLAITNFKVEPPWPIAPGTAIGLSWTVTGSDHWQLFDSDTATLLYDSNTSRPPNLTQWPVPPAQLTPAAETTYELIAWAGQLFTNAFAVAQVTNPRFTSIGDPTANPTSVDSGAPSTLSWQTADADYVIVTASGYASSQIKPDANGNGQLQVNPRFTTTYTVTPYGAGGGEKGEIGQVAVSVNPPTVLSIAATPNLSASGATVNLSWQTQSGVSASLSRTTYGSNEVIEMGGVALNSNGQAVKPPDGLTIYILTVVGQGQTTAQVAVANPPQTIDTLATLDAYILYDNVNLLLWELHSSVDVIFWRNVSNGNLIGQTPHGAVGDVLNAMAFDGEYVWVTSKASGLIQIRASNGHIVAIGMQQDDLTAPDSIGYDSAHKTLWVVHNEGASVSRIMTTYQMLAEPDIEFGDVEARPAFDGANAWIADVDAEELCIVNASNGTIVQKVSSNATCLTFDGKNIWAGCDDGHVRKFDGQGKVLAECRAANTAIVDILFDGTNIWTANSYDQTVSMIDSLSGTLLAAFPMNGINPIVLAFDGSSIWILGRSRSHGEFSNTLLKLVAASPPSSK